jgi:hypothetical protein
VDQVPKKTSMKTITIAWNKKKMKKMKITKKKKTKKTMKKRKNKLKD